MQASSQYPSDAAYGGDFISGAAQRKIIEPRPGGNDHVRDEVIILTDRAFDAQDIVLQGRVCISETTVRAMGALVDLVPRDVVRRVEYENGQIRAELDRLEAQLIEAQQLIDHLRAADRILAPPTLGRSLSAQDEAAPAVQP